MEHKYLDFEMPEIPVRRPILAEEFCEKLKLTSRMWDKNLKELLTYVGAIFELADKAGDYPEPEQPRPCFVCEQRRLREEALADPIVPIEQEPTST